MPWCFCLQSKDEQDVRLAEMVRVNDENAATFPMMAPAASAASAVAVLGAWQGSLPGRFAVLFGGSVAGLAPVLGWKLDRMCSKYLYVSEAFCGSSVILSTLAKAPLQWWRP